MLKINCLFCEQEINISSRARIGDLVSCSSCKTMFRLVWLYPVEIDWLDMTENPDEVDTRQIADAERSSTNESQAEEE